jgi:mitogen-activated protein kinase kinase
MEPPTTRMANGDPESSSSEHSATPSPQPSPNETDDAEVAAWVQDALDRRLSGTIGTPEKPALHAVALDAVAGSPLLEDPSTIFPIA